MLNPISHEFQATLTRKGSNRKNPKSLQLQEFLQWRMGKMEKNDLHASFLSFPNWI